MAERVRVSIQVPPDLFEAMDKKRFEDKTSFQEVGERLFREWLGEKPPEYTNGEREACEILVQLMRNRDKLDELRQHILDEFLFASKHIVARLPQEKTETRKG